MFSLESKVGLVTGSSRGIGRAIAIVLARAGASVVLNHRNSSTEAVEVAEAIAGEGRRVLTVQADVGNEDQVVAMVKQVIKEFGRIDILVNNAGITSDNLVALMPLSQWQSVLSADLTSAFLCAKAALPHMVRARWGRIINISSAIGLIGQAGQANYAAAKAGLVGLTKSLALEYGSRGITANAIAPGLIDTEMIANLPRARVEHVLEHISVRRLGTPQDVGYVCAFLSSEEAAYINGQVIGVDGAFGLTHA